MPSARPSALLDTRVIYCGDNLDQLRKLPDACVDLIYNSQIRRGGDPPFNSNRNYEVFWGETKEKRAFEDRHVSPRLAQLSEPCVGGVMQGESERCRIVVGTRKLQCFLSKSRGLIGLPKMPRG